MDVREKLVELLMEFPLAYDVCDKQEKKECGDTPCCECLANHLIANGVTVQEWISVEDRLPEQGQEVIVYSGGVLKPTVFAYQFWNKNYDSWARITHWMPLPQPPKGE